MDKKIDEQNINTRRDFLKKAVYAAPAIVALGSISNPVFAGQSCTGDCFDSSLSRPIGKDSEEEGF